MKASDCVHAASRIGHRVAEQARWRGDLCTWEIKVLDSGPGLSTVGKTAGPELYQGSSGISWFLGELFERTGEEPFRRGATGGILHALDEAENLPPGSFGFHGGRVGIAWAAARLARLLERPELLVSSWTILEPLRGSEEQDQGIDVISGAAGAIPALLELGELLERPEPGEIARALGDRLLLLAQQEPGGWSWNTLPGTSVRHLLGLAHGTAGIALALLELARATGEGRFLFAAQMAFLYENRFFDERVSNWPDLRDQRLGEEVRSGRHETLRQAVRIGWMPRCETHFMTAWCHGSPGIGLSRLRAYELTGQERYRRDLRAAVDSTLGSIRGDELRAANFSLCHGTAGNCELPLAACQVLGDPVLREACLEAAQYGWETFGKDGGGWPCGTLTGEADPSLLIGEAGIGTYFLRLADPSLPSPLLLRPNLARIDREGLGPELPGFEESLRQAEEFFFGTTAGLWSRLRPDWKIPPEPGGEVPLVVPPVVHRYREMCRFLEHAAPSSKLLEDAFRVDQERYLLASAESDFTHDFVRALARFRWQEIDVRQVRFRLAFGAALTETRWDWQSWPAEASEPPEEEAYFLLLRQSGQVSVRRVGPFAFLLLDSVRGPALYSEILEAVSEALEGAAPDPEALEAQVLPQLQQLYEIGAFDVVLPEQGAKEMERAVVSV